jgi:hypothetical protein
MSESVRILSEARRNYEARNTEEMHPSSIPPSSIPPSPPPPTPLRGEKFWKPMTPDETVETKEELGKMRSRRSPSPPPTSVQSDATTEQTVDEGSVLSSVDSTNEKASDISSNTT